MMTKNAIKIKTLFIAILGFIACSCSTGDKPLTINELKQIVEKQNNMLANCFKEGNAEKLSEMYTDSAKLSPNGYDFVFGRDSIKAFWAKDFETTKVLEMNTLILKIEGNKDIIYETGKAFTKMIIQDTIYYDAKVKYINVWRRQANGDYKLDVDFWNKDSK